MQTGQHVVQQIYHLSLHAVWFAVSMFCMANLSAFWPSLMMKRMKCLLKKILIVKKTVEEMYVITAHFTNVLVLQLVLVNCWSTLLNFLR